MFVAWRDLRQAMGALLNVCGFVMCFTVLVGLLSGLTAGLGRENTSAVTGLPADHLAFAAPADGREVSFTDSRLDRDAWERWSRVPGVRKAEPLSIAMTRGEAGSSAAALSAFGVRPDSGLAPAPLRDGAVVLSEQAADELGLAAGDSFTLGGRHAVVASVAGDAMYSHTPVVWVPFTGGRATVVALDTAPGADLAAADRELGTRTVARDDALQAIGSFTAENGSLQLMRGFLFAISALVIGAFFTVWTIQRSGDVAILKALGASTGYLLRDALGQAVVLLVLGTGAGTALAAGVGAAVGGTVPFVLDVSTVLVPMAVMIALGAAGAALSVRRITSVDPLTALGSAR